MKRTQQNLPLSAVSVDDRFWNRVQELVREVVVPYQADILEDKVSVNEKSHAVENFRIAAGEAVGEHHGFVFQDSDVYKWLEAASCSLALRFDEKLDARMDGIIRLIGKAQQDDGYINTFFTIREPERKWLNLRDDHELYCFGHLIEAGVAHTLATGKTNLLDIVCRAADLISRRFGTDGERGFPGHEEVELALLRLYRVTGKKEYLETARYFIEERGKIPGYFEIERESRSKDPRPTHDEYHQSHLPVREQKEAVGHSVRAMYLYTAMADLAAETDDDPLYEACRVLLDNILNEKLYITGGLGSTFHGEAFSPGYDLPNDTVYAETCASIGMCFFARKMLEIKPEGFIADLLERQLYNTVLAGMQLDGKSFFYVNPLEVIPGISGVAPTHKHALPRRPEWHACACCPPNLSRLLLSLGRYAWGEGKNTIYSHLWLGGSAEFKVAGGGTITCESEYPRKGSVRYTVDPSIENANFTIAVHLPFWCRNIDLTVNGALVEAEIKDGYAYLTRCWYRGDVIGIRSEMPVLRLYSNLSVRNNAGRVALQKGPFVYCFEQIDNGAPLAALRLPAKADIREFEIKSGALTGLIALSADGLRENSLDPELYSENRPVAVPAQLMAVPYFAWGNREPGAMQVWIRE